MVVVVVTVKSGRGLVMSVVVVSSHTSDEVVSIGGVVSVVAVVQIGSKI